MDSIKAREAILNGPILKTMGILAWPAILAAGLQALYGLVNAFWLGRLSPAAMAAPGLAWLILFFVMSFASGFQGAGTAFVAQYFGAKDQKSAEQVVGQILGFLALVSVFLAAIGYFLAPLALRLLGTPEEIYLLALSYLRIECLGLPFMFLARATGGILVGLGNTRLNMYLAVSSLLINAGLTPIFIFGWLGFPALGVAGAAWATVLSHTLIALVALSLLATGRMGIKLQVRNLRFRWEVLRSILRVGLPNVLDQMATSFGFVVMMGLVTGFGTAVVAAYTVGNRIIHLINVVCWGAGSALMAMIGQNLGAENYERAETIARRGIFATFIALVGLYFVTFVSRRPLFALFISDQEVIREGMWYIAIFGISVPFFGLFDGAAAVFRGSGHTVPPLIMALVRLWAFRVFLAWLLGHNFGLGTTGMWVGMTISNVLAGIALVLWLKRGTWKRRVIRPFTSYPARDTS